MVKLSFFQGFKSWVYVGNSLPSSTVRTSFAIATSSSFDVGTLKLNYSSLERLFVHRCLFEENCFAHQSKFASFCQAFGSIFLSFSDPYLKVNF